MSVRIREHIVALSLLPAIMGCSRDTRLDHAELQSDFRATASLSSETEAFVRRLEAHAYSAHFIEGHLTYLQRQGTEVRNKLTAATVDQSDIVSLLTLKEATGELVRTIEDLRSQAAAAPARQTALEHFHAIHQRLEQDMPR